MESRSKKAVCFSRPFASSQPSQFYFVTSFSTSELLLNTHIHTRTLILTYTHSYTQIYTFKNSHSYTPTLGHLHTYTYSHTLHNIYTYTLMFTHNNIHTYSHIHIHTPFPSGRVPGQEMQVITHEVCHRLVQGCLNELRAVPNVPGSLQRYSQSTKYIPLYAQPSIISALSFALMPPHPPTHPPYLVLCQPLLN